MTAQTSTTLKGTFQTDDVPTEAQFADLIDSFPNSVDLAAATGTDLLDDPIADAFTPDDYVLPAIATGGVLKALPTGVAFVNARQYERTFKLSDWGPASGYATNNPLLTRNNADPDSILPHNQTYDPAVYDSAQALFDALTDLGAAYYTTGFDLVIPPGFWNVGTVPTGARTSIRTGTAQSGTSTTITLDASASGFNDEYNGQIVTITGGTGSGQFRRITDYQQSLKRCTVDIAWTTTPDNTSTFEITTAHLLPLPPRGTIRTESNNYLNACIIRGTNVNGDLFGHWSTRSDVETINEIKDTMFWGVMLEGARNKGFTGGTTCPWDLIHWEKPLYEGNWGDSRLRVLYCHLRGAIRYNLFYSARGDSEIRFNRMAACGDSAVRIELSTDNHFTDNLMVGTGRHGFEGHSMANTEFSGNQLYFTGQNQGDRWDGSLKENVREHGSAMKLLNCNNVRGSDNRFEDTSGHGIWVSSAGDAVRFTGSYFNNLGALGGFEDSADGVKDFGFAGITCSNRNGSGPTGTVDGVDAIYFDNNAAGLQNCVESQCHGLVRQARTNQQMRAFVSFDPVATRSKPFKDLDIDLRPGYLDTPNIPRSILDGDLWTGAGRLDFFEQECRFVASTVSPVDFIRSSLRYAGRPMRGFIDRTRNIRSEIHNMFDTSTSYALSVAEVTANITAAVWSQASSVNRITYTVDADLRSSITTKMAVKVVGAADAAHNGIWNVDSITATEIRVINMGIVDASKDFTGGSADVEGPVAEVVLDDGLAGQKYRIRVGSRNASAAPLEIRSLDGNITTTIATAPAILEFEYDPVTGWEAA